MGMIEVSDDVLKDLQRLAADNCLTLEKQAETMLRQAIGQALAAEAFAVRWDRIAAMSPKPGPLSDSLPLLRGDRDR